MATERPKDITIKGRLSFPKFTMTEALAFNRTSKYAKPDERVRPHFFMLLDDVQQDKLVSYIRDQFLPWAAEQGKLPDPEKKSGLSAGQVKKLTKILDEKDWEVDAVLGLINPVAEQTAELAPETVASVKVNGLAGQDLVQKAVVRSEDELANPVDDLIIPERGMILPVKDTVHELYPGCYVAAQLNLWAFVSAGNPGITASTGTVVFVGDGERFGGGAGLDEDEVFMSLDD